MNNLNQQYLSYTSDAVLSNHNDSDKNRDAANFTNNLCSKNSLDNSTAQPLISGSCTNSGFNFGFSSRLQYDPSFINDDIEQSTAPILSVLDPNRVKNVNECLSLFGPRAGHNGVGDSLPIANPGLTPAQELVDIDSIMSNRNVKQDRSKRGMVNDVDVFKFKTYDVKYCDRGLDPLSSIATYPKQLYREMSINRFYDLNLNPQTNIYYDWATNTQLEAKDNYDYPYPFSLDGDKSLPKEVKGKSKQCETTCKQNCNVNVLNNQSFQDSDSELESLIDSDSDNEY